MAVRILALAVWLLLPVGVFAWHMGPGQDREQLDVADRLIREAEKLAAAGDHAGATEKYAEAIKELPEGRTAEARKLRLERAKSQMLANQLPEANGDLKGLIDELVADPTADPKLLADARSVYANSQYYVTWLMRLEGLGAEEWEPEAEAARQTYKLLAEQAEQAGDAAAVRKHTEDLEAAIRLARMDLTDLHGLPLPCQCKGCCSNCNGKSGRKPGKKEGPKPEKQDIRSAGKNPAPDDTGH
jgi:hypothetical protein